MTYHQRCVVGHYVAINKLIAKNYKHNIEMDDGVNASTKIRDGTMTCDTMNNCDASDVVMCLTTM